MRVLVVVTLALCGTVGLLWGAGSLLIRQVETELGAGAPWGPDTSFVTTRSGRVHLLDVGTGAAVLLVHGSGRSIADWQEGLAERLAATRRVIAFDSYGFGLSARDHPGQYGLALWARQAVDVLDALGIDRAVILGHSAGGAVAACLAADHPERFRGGCSSATAWPWTCRRCCHCSQGSGSCCWRGPGSSGTPSRLSIASEWRRRIGFVAPARRC